MDRLLSVSRAARLVGISRGKLQRQIQDGELPSFEGKVRLTDVEMLYPQAEIEKDTIIEHIEEIIENAMQRARGEKLQKLLAPDLGRLAARVSALSKELANIKSRENYYLGLLNTLSDKISQHQQQAADNNSFLVSLNNWLSDSIANPQFDTSASSLLAKDTFLKVMASQVHLMPSGHEYFIDGNNSILDSGLSAGLALNYGCSNGNCGKCKAKLISGEVEKIRDYDYAFSESEKNQDYILTCCYTALTDVVLKAEEASSSADIPLQHISTRVKKVQALDDDLELLHLKTPRTNRLRFMAGQNATIHFNDSQEINLPIASCPCDDMNIQFHVPHSNNKDIKRLLDHLKTNSTVDIEGPNGNFVLKEDSDNPVIFVAYNDGFSAIKSLIEHAMTLETAEFIHLYWIVSEPHKHYMHNLCRSWTDALDNFRYTPLKIGGDDNHDLHTDRLQQITDTYAKLGDNFDIYINGPAQLTRFTQEFFINAGADKSSIVINTANESA